MSHEASEPLPRLPRLRRIAKGYLWNRKTLRAMVIASPAVLATASSVSLGIMIDRQLGGLNAERDGIAQEIGRLDQFTKDFESKELLRASFLVSLASAGAADELKYTLDKLYRVSAAGSLRRIAASIYPSTWKERIADYDALVASDYREAATVRKLQAFENDVLQDARKRLTDQQATSNRLSDQIERLEGRKATAQTVLNAVMYVVTILAFFFQTAV